MANSGVNKTTFNLLERLLSGDLNQLQQDISGALMDAWYAMYGWDRSEYGSGTPYWQRVETPVLAEPTTGPLKSVILSGLLVNPQSGFLLVDQGALCTVQPTGVSGESRMVLARSPGVTDSGAFPFIPNAGPGPRWDILECRPRVTNTNAMRDIFDPVTQQFDGTSVLKTSVTDLEFRYTAGTAGSPAAPPTISAGWQPLCALWVPSAAASFDDVELFDVRPTLSGMEDPNAGFNSANGGRYPQDDVHSAYRHINVISGSSPSKVNTTRTIGAARIIGLVQSQFDTTATPGYSSYGQKGYSAEFPLQATNPGLTLTGVAPSLLDDATAVSDTLDYGANGATYQETTLYSFGVMFPFGLARWHKYANVGAAIAGRRWPCLQPGLTFIVTGGLPLGVQNIGFTLPAAYDTDITGQYGIILGWLESGVLTWNQYPSEGDWDGWYTFASPRLYQAADGVGVDEANWNNFIVGNTPSDFLPYNGLLYDIAFELQMSGTAGEATARGSMSAYNNTTRTSDGTNTISNFRTFTVPGVARGAAGRTPNFIVRVWANPAAGSGFEAMKLSFTGEAFAANPSVRFYRANLKAVGQ